MNILLYSTDFDVSKIYFLDKKTNMIMDGVFTKIIYSNNCMSMNGIYIDFPIKNVTNKNNSKNIMQFDVLNNKDMIQKMTDIEKQIIHYYIQYFSLSSHRTQENVQNKTIMYNLKNQLQNGTIKYYKEYEHSQKPSSYYIKFSGIWENQSEIGITFKLIEYQKKT